MSDVHLLSAPNLNMNTSRSMPVGLVILGFLLAALLGFAWLFLMPAPDQRPGPELRHDRDIVQLAGLRNEGLARLENGEWRESTAIFLELEELLPDDPLPVRNLAVSRVLHLAELPGNRDAAELAADRQRASAALERVKELEPDQEAGFLLASRLEQNGGDLPRAVQELEQAAVLAPGQASTWYELYSITRHAEDENLRQRGRDGLKRAFELAPANLIVILDWLLVQADSRDAAITTTLDLAEPTLAGIAAGIEQRVRVDIRQFLTAAREAVAQADWNTVLRNVRILNNVTRADDAAQSDRIRIERHALELVLEEFAPEIERQIAELRTQNPPAIPVTFQPLDLGIEGESPVLDVKIADFNLDGRNDLCLLREGRIEVYAVAAEGAGWRPVGGVDVPEGMHGVLAINLDNVSQPPVMRNAEQELCHSAPLDLVLHGDAGLAIFKSGVEESGGVTFTPVEPGEEFAAVRNVRRVIASDLNNDGDLDLVVLAAEGLSLWSNRGDFTFRRLDVETDRGEALPVDVVSVDWDRDIDSDLLVLLDSGRIGYLENLRHGTFRWRELEEAQSEHPGAGGIAVADVEHNGTWGLLLADSAGLAVIPTRMPQRGAVRLQDRRPLGGPAADRLLAFDYDNDGQIDLLTYGAGNVTLWRGRADGSFEDSTQAVLPLESRGNVTAADVGDLDGDGDDDLVFILNGKLVALSNEGGNANHWLEVALLAQQVARGEASASGRVNHYGIGSVIELRAGAGYQQRQVTRQRTRFGLGPLERADALRVLWPNGIPENVLHPRANELVCDRQSLKGSCPYLYTWNGEQYVFVTDLLWAAPIGLQDARGELVPCREWEYLKIPGELLTPIDGEYRLQLTEELWEVAYFDHVQLLVVDHPEELEIYSNEKVGPPSLADFQIHTVTMRRSPVSAINHRGRDLLPLLLTRDERYARPFDEKLMQGYTEDSYIELDLGLTEKPGRLKLFLTGWIYPTDTSINVGLSENAALPGPRPPWISVPDEAGTFVEVVPFMGFPGGKTKTIVVDISNIFLTDNFRLRINTSQELYWDEIFYTTDDDAFATHFQCVAKPLELVAADLHYRGVSQRIEHPHDGPETYDYDRVDPAPAWPAISGGFTRYGDVRELIADEDDRLVIMGAGDELTLRFAVPDAPLPAGWKRDFILYNVGWDKDADLNTVYGTTVEPLPVRGTSAYPDWERAANPDREHDLRTWQTRTFDPRPFRRKMFRRDE